MAQRKGTLATRKVKHGPNKGKTAQLVTIRNAAGKITHSYRTKASRSDQ